MRSQYFFSNFGSRDVRNGQIQKALSLSKLFERIFGSGYVPVDVVRNKFSLRKVFTEFHKENVYLVSLGRNGIRLFAVFFLISAKVLFLRERPAVYYFVVGGWLGDLARKSLLIRIFLREAQVVLVETEGLARELRCLGLSAIVFPNFRSFQYEGSKRLSESTIRLCFCGRIREDKGVLVAMDLVDYMRSLGVEVLLDFFGVIDCEIEARFSSRLIPNVIQYKGTYSTENEAIQILRRYDFLVLPTSYYGECMPGVVVEAFCAGTPVICSDWRSMGEVVNDGRDGFVVGLHNFVSDAACILMKVKETNEYAKLSSESLNSARHKYSEDAALSILREVLVRFE